MRYPSCSTREINFIFPSILFCLFNKFLLWIAGTISSHSKISYFYVFSNTIFLSGKKLCITLMFMKYMLILQEYCSTNLSNKKWKLLGSNRDAKERDWYLFNCLLLLPILFVLCSKYKRSWFLCFCFLNYQRGISTKTSKYTCIPQSKRTFSKCTDKLATITLYDIRTFATVHSYVELLHSWSAK